MGVIGYSALVVKASMMLAPIFFTCDYRNLE
jgi:hypothetical protein